MTLKLSGDPVEYQNVRSGIQSGVHDGGSCGVTALSFLASALTLALVLCRPQPD
jgi:hypothetical protein